MFESNQLNVAYSEEFLLSKFAQLILDTGHFPVAAELRMVARRGPDFPSHNVFAGFGSKRQLAARVRDYCTERTGYEAVKNICVTIAGEQNRDDPVASLDSGPGIGISEGYVYLALLTLGREGHYKIGKAVLVVRRTDQISIQFPEALQPGPKPIKNLANRTAS